MKEVLESGFRDLDNSFTLKHGGESGINNSEGKYCFCNRLAVPYFLVTTFLTTTLTSITPSNEAIVVAGERT